MWQIMGNCRCDTFYRPQIVAYFVFVIEDLYFSELLMSIQSIINVGGISMLIGKWARATVEEVEAELVFWVREGVLGDWRGSGSDGCWGWDIVLRGSGSRGQ